MASIFHDGIPFDNPKLLLSWEMSQTDFCTQLGLVNGPPRLIFEHLFNCKFLSGIESSCRVHFVEGKLKKVRLPVIRLDFIMRSAKNCRPPSVNRNEFPKVDILTGQNWLGTLKL